MHRFKVGRYLSVLMLLLWPADETIATSLPTAQKKIGIYSAKKSPEK